MMVNSFQDSKAYVLYSKQDFDYSFYYNKFCAGLNREQVSYKFKSDIENLNFDIDATDSLATEWIKEQHELDFPLIKAQDVDAFWILYNEKQNYYRRLVRENDYSVELHNTHIRNRTILLSSTSNIPAPRIDHNVVESDSLVFFNERSVSSILKSHGKKLYAKYNTLSAEDKALCGFYLNGILDLTNNREDGQRQLFSNDQWQYLKKHLRSKKIKHLKNLSSATEEKLNEIIKEIKAGNEEEAYYLAIENIRPAHRKDKCIFKIIGHIINAYKERAYIFNKPSEKVGELDFLLKLWGEILELLFGDEEALNINWGETVPDVTTAVERDNNGNKPHTIGCKVDGRVVCNITKIVDTCHTEAEDLGKLYSDKFKLAAESKCIIDDIVMSHKLSGIKQVVMQNIQIFGLQADVCSLKLMDRGLYVNTLDFDLSFNNSLVQFSKHLKMWIRQLLNFKKSCLSLVSASSQASNVHQNSLSDVFKREEDINESDKYCNPSWITGTFLPSTLSNPPVFPQKLLTTSSGGITNRSIKKRREEVYLEDGIKVLSKFSDEKKKRDCPTDAESSTRALKRIHHVEKKDKRDMQISQY